jgi:hypothetical protein
MPSLTHRIVFVTGMLLGAPVPLSAAVVFDPAADGIDRVCQAYVTSAAPRDVISLARVDTHDGNVPVWRRSDPAAAARAKKTPDDFGGDFAAVTYTRGGIVFASIAHVEPQGAGIETRTWCFIGGRLSRATVELDPVNDLAWRRRLYYGDDLDKPFSEYVTPVIPAGSSDPHAKPPSNMLLVNAFGTPAKLPWYEPANAALTATAKMR